MEVRVGLHQGSALSPFLFAIIMDVLTKDVRKEAPWDIMFADDVVLCREDKEELEVSLERWRKIFEERGLRVSRKKTEYLQAEGAKKGTVFIQGETVKKVDHFKYLGVVVSADGSCEEEVRRRMQAGWQSWRRVSGVLCDRKLSARLKGKIKCAVRPAVLYGMETVAVTERMVKKMEAAELKMVRWALGGGDIEGQGEERVHPGDSEDQKNLGKAEGRETEMVRACEEKGRKLHRQKNDEKLKYQGRGQEGGRGGGGMTI